MKIQAPIRYVPLLLLAAAACKSVPYTKRKQLVLVSAGEETALGQSAYTDALSKAKVSTDAAATAMVKRVGERIAAVSDRPDFKWEFNLLDDPKTINAWCLPGGKVAVYSGILPVAQDDDGLAVVLGHEISHALARHGSERMSQGLLAQLGGVALGAAMASKPAETQQLAQQAYGAGAQVGVLLPFSRAQESEADHIGLILMAKAGYEPGTAVEFWRRMSKAAGGKDSTPEFLRTHPLDEKRIKAIEDELPEARGYLKK
jgi:predicted Zn-dependent protease